MDGWIDGLAGWLLIHWLIDWLIDELIDLLIDRWMDCWIDGLAGLLLILRYICWLAIDPLVDSLTDPSIDASIKRMSDWLIYSFFDGMGACRNYWRIDGLDCWFIVFLTACFTEWFIDCTVGRFIARFIERLIDRRSRSLAHWLIRRLPDSSDFLRRVESLLHLDGDWTYSRIPRFAEWCFNERIDSSADSVAHWRIRGFIPAVADWRIEWLIDWPI